jgi:hypothetical protein
MNQRIRCPNPTCPQPEDVQKVSIVVRSATIEGLEPGHYNVMTSLSKQLEAPAQPEYSDKWGWKLLAWVLALGYLSLASLAEFAFLTAGITALPPGDTPTPAAFLVFGIGTSAIFLWIIIWHRLTANRYRRWKKATRVWDQLYYCKHCGSVFNPNVENGEHYVQASQTKELLK